MSDSKDVLVHGEQLFAALLNNLKILESWTFPKRILTTDLAKYLSNASALQTSVDELSSWYAVILKLTPSSIHPSVVLNNVQASVGALLEKCERFHSTNVRKNKQYIAPGISGNPIAQLQSACRNVLRHVKSVEEFKCSLWAQVVQGPKPISGYHSASYTPTFMRAPEVPEYALLNFDSATSAEAKLWHATFNKAPMSPRVIIVSGAKGVGKTVAVSAIVNHSKSKIRFPDGIAFIQIGPEGSLSDVLHGIANYVELSGSADMANEMRSARFLADAVTLAQRLLRDLCCLFFVSDFGNVNNVDYSVVEEMSRLSKHSLSRFVVTSCDPLPKSPVLVRISPRESESSGKILLNAANLQMPRNPSALNAMTRVSVLCGGLPVLLSIAGKTIQELAKQPHLDGNDLVWMEYLTSISSGNESNTAKKIVLKALAVAGKAMKEEHCKKYFTMLCVLRKGHFLSLEILQRLWCQSEERCVKIINFFQHFALLRVEKHFKLENALTIGLSDIVLQVARQLAQQESTTMLPYEVLIASYQSGASVGTNGSNNRSGELSLAHFKDWWLQVEDDGYIHYNIVWLLSKSSRHEEIVWLMNQPQWIVKLLKGYGYLKVCAELNVACSSLSCVSWSEMRRENLRRWFSTLDHTMALNCTDLKTRESKELALTQLYRHLNYFHENDPLVTSFIAELRNSAFRANS